eukprot:jgi/Tetstr1/429362/TSEL_019279.t1
MGRRNSKRRIPQGKEDWTGTKRTWEEVTKRMRCHACGASVSKTYFYDIRRWTEASAKPPDTAAPVAAGGDGAPAAPRRQLYTGADAILMEAALNICEWKLKHNIKTAAFERLSKLLKHMLPMVAVGGEQGNLLFMRGGQYAMRVRGCPRLVQRRYGHRRACVAAGGRRTRDEGVIWKGDPGDFYMKVIAKKFRGVWHYGVITGVVTEWVLEDYGGATQWRAVFEDGSGKVTVQSGWVMEDCLHHMETFSILNAGPLLEEARVKAIMTEKELRVPRRAAPRRGGRGSAAPRRGGRGSAAPRRGGRGSAAPRQRRPGQRGAKTAAAGAARRQDSGGRGSAAPRQRRPGQRGAKTAAAGAARRQDSGGRGSAAPRRGGRGSAAPRRGGRGSAAPRQRRPGQRGAKTAAAGAARRQGAAAGAARRQDSGGRGSAAPRQRRPGQRGAKARRPGQRGAKARRPGQRGAKARRPGQRGAKARRPGQRGAKTAAAGAARRQDSAYSGIGGKGCITSCGRQPLKTMRSCRNNPSTGFWIPLIWLTAAGCGMQGRMTEVAVLVSPQSLHAAEAAQPHRH